MNLGQVPDMIGRERAWNAVSWVGGLLGALVVKKALRAGSRRRARLDSGHRSLPPGTVED